MEWTSGFMKITRNAVGKAHDLRYTAMEIRMRKYA